MAQHWLITSDFNAILSPQDMLDGAAVTLNEIKDFEECIQNMGITDYLGRDNTIHGLIRSMDKIESIELLVIMTGWLNGGM